MTQQTIEQANQALQQGRFDDAEKLLRGAVQSDPQSADAHVALATLLRRKQDHAAAAESFANAMRIDRNRKGLAFSYAVSCFRAGRYDEAEKSARFALQSEPNVEAYSALASILREQGKLDQALEAAEQALRLAPANNPALHAKASTLLAMGRAAEALAIFEDLQKRGVAAPVIAIGHGAALEELGRAQDAERLYADAAIRWANFAELKREHAHRRH
jgi:Tfp pilus assembly protein PilF